MKLQVRCLFGDVETDMNLAVGSGHKSFKWLGLTTAARFGSRAPQGTRRRREPQHITAKNVTFMPLEIFTEKVAFFHPDDEIIDHFVDGDSITVRLGKHMGVNKFGRPELTR